jgi:hypothetical protein
MVRTNDKGIIPPIPNVPRFNSEEPSCAEVAEPPVTAVQATLEVPASVAPFIHSEPMMLIVAVFTFPVLVTLIVCGLDGVPAMIVPNPNDAALVDIVHTGKITDASNAAIALDNVVAAESTSV